MDSDCESSANLLRMKFSPAEDEILKNAVQKIGARKWSAIASYLPGRTARQCRDRFQNYLKPNLTNGPWSHDEDTLLLQKVKEYGSSWSKISQFFNGRSPNNLKNRYNTHLSKFNSSKKSRPKKESLDFPNLELQIVQKFNSDEVNSKEFWEIFSGIEMNEQSVFSPDFNLLY